MFKKLVTAALFLGMLQGVAYADNLSLAKSPVIENKASVIFNQIEQQETANPADYDSPEIFANFREIKTTGIKPKTVYRTSNPLNIYGNKVRHNFADKLAKQAGIQAEIDLADSDDDLKSYFKNSGVRKKYCYSLYQKGKLFNTELHGIGLNAKDWDKMASAFRFMLNNDGPYLVHCRLGKDRAGIFSMLCSALAGATVKDLQEDYMLTYCNYYHIQPNSYEYEIIKKFQANKLVYFIAHPEYAKNNQRIPDNISVNDIVPEQAAVAFFKTALNFTDAEIAMLQAKLKDDRISSTY